MKYGLVSREAAAILTAMETDRRYWPRLFKSWGKNNAIQMASINRKLEEYYEMAKAAKKAVSSGQTSKAEFSWKGFVECKLSDSDKANYLAWDVADSDVWDGIAQYCEAGIKIALSYNTQNASFNCAGTGQPASGANNGYCVVAHAKTPYEAARVWLFKVATILPATWSEYDAGDSEDIG